MTVRSIPSALQAHLDGHTTTTTRLLRIQLTDGFVYGLCMLDQDVEYDDGDGPINYIASNGFDPTTLSADTAYTVSNAEGNCLLAQGIDGITLEDVRAGRLNDATFKLYLVNFRDLSMGHAVLDAGDVGEVYVRQGIVWTPEMLSYVMRLKQTVGSTWSRRGRCIFGTPANSQTGCGIDLTPLWANGTVVSVGAEPDREFTGSTLSNDSPPTTKPPARVQFLTGANAGREFPIETVAGLSVTLLETTPYAIAPGDTYRARPDCGKRYIEDCIGVWNNGINFKGEPLIPVGDAAGGQTPGAQLGRGGGFVGDQPDD